MKEIYETPVTEVICFDTEDVITTSNLSDITGGSNDTPVVK